MNNCTHTPPEQAFNKKSFDEVLYRICTIEIPETFDIVVAIANGGIIPAALINMRIKALYQVLHIRRRDSANKILHEEPILLTPMNFSVEAKRILLVDDRAKTGATLAFAKQLLIGAKEVKTFVVNGVADYSLYNEACFHFPWVV